jgi:hypothetical protein
VFLIRWTQTTYINDDLWEKGTVVSVEIVDVEEIE